MREPPPAQGGGSEKGEREVETLWILAACAGASGLPFLRRLLRIPEENRERTLAGVLPQLRQAIRGMLATLFWRRPWARRQLCWRGGQRPRSGKLRGVFTHFKGGFPWKSLGLRKS